MLHFASTILQAFLKLENLECLYLQHNNLTSIPTNLPRSLKDLRLNHNKIEQVAFFFFFFTPLRICTFIFENSNQHFCQVIAADVEGMDNLTVLYLNDNAIKDIGSSLKALTSLTLLDVSSNQLTKVTV